jgi:hypothetical protein
VCGVLLGKVLLDYYMCPYILLDYYICVFIHYYVSLYTTRLLYMCPYMLLHSCIMCPRILLHDYYVYLLQYLLQWHMSPHTSTFIYISTLLIYIYY